MEREESIEDDRPFGVGREAERRGTRGLEPAHLTPQLVPFLFAERLDVRFVVVRKIEDRGHGLPRAGHAVARVGEHPAHRVERGTLLRDVFEPYARRALRGDPARDPGRDAAPTARPRDDIPFVVEPAPPEGPGAVTPRPRGPRAAS